MVKVSKGVGITTTNPLEVPRSVIESETGSFCAHSPLHSEASSPVLRGHDEWHSHLPAELLKRGLGFQQYPGNPKSGQS